MRLPFRLVLMTALVLPGTLLAQSSPFVGKKAGQSSGSSTANPTESDYAFTGVVTMGDDTLVCITEVAKQRSHWIKVGQSYSGLAVTAHHPETKQVTIRRGGQETTLALTERSFDPAQLQAYQPAAASAAPMAGLAVPVALTKEEKETEARMLVSDLLEIGQIQRKAYAEARKAKADEEAKPANPPRP